MTMQQLLDEKEDDKVVYIEGRYMMKTTKQEPVEEKEDDATASGGGR